MNVVVERKTASIWFERKAMSLSEAVLGGFISLGSDFSNYSVEIPHEVAHKFFISIAAKNI